MFERNTVVWAKVRGFPWWPSYTEERMPNGHYKVQFIGEKTYQYVPPDKIKSWAENFEEFTKVKRNKKNEKFFSAVELGVNINANIINFEDQYLFISNCMKKLSHFTEEDVRKFCQSIKNIRKKVVTIPNKKNITKNLPTKNDNNKKGMFHKKVEPVPHNNNINSVNTNVNVNVNGSNTLQLNKSKLHSSIKLNHGSHSGNSSNNNGNSSNINNHNHHNNKIIIHLNNNNNNNNINHKRLSRSTNDKDDPITLNEFNNTHSSTITRALSSNNFRNDKGQTQLDSYFPNQHLNRHQSQKMNNKVLDFSKEIEELVSCQTEIKEELEFIFTKLEKYNILSHLPIDISKLDFTKRDKNERVILTKKELINYLIFLCSIIQIPSDINKYLSSLIKELKSFPHD